MAPQHTFHAETAADRDAAIACLVAEHTATLDLAESLTDFDTTLANIRSARRLVRDYSRQHNLGMLGRNGIGPQIASILRSAQFHGRTRTSLTTVWVSADRTRVAA